MLCVEKAPFSRQLLKRPKGTSKLTSFFVLSLQHARISQCTTGQSRRPSSASLSRTKNMQSRSGLAARASLLSYPQSKYLSQTKRSKASATSVKARLSHGPCGTHASGQGDLLHPTDLFLPLAWHCPCRDTYVVDSHDCLTSWY